MFVSTTSLRKINRVCACVRARARVLCKVWVSRIRKDGAPRHLGSFPTEWQAAAKYDEHARRMNDPQRPLNFPDNYTAEDMRAHVERRRAVKLHLLSASSDSSTSKNVQMADGKESYEDSEYTDHATMDSTGIFENQCPSVASAYSFARSNPSDQTGVSYNASTNQQPMLFGTLEVRPEPQSQALPVSLKVQPTVLQHKSPLTPLPLPLPLPVVQPIAQATAAHAEGGGGNSTTTSTTSASLISLIPRLNS